MAEAGVMFLHHWFRGDELASETREIGFVWTLHHYFDGLNNQIQSPNLELNWHLSITFLKVVLARIQLKHRIRIIIVVPW